MWRMAAKGFGSEVAGARGVEYLARLDTGMSCWYLVSMDFSSPL